MDGDVSRLKTKQQLRERIRELELENLKLRMGAIRAVDLASPPVGASHRHGKSDHYIDAVAYGRFIAQARARYER